MLSLIVDLILIFVYWDDWSVTEISIAIIGWILCAIYAVSRDNKE